MQSRFPAIALGLLALGSAAACQSYSMEGVDPQTIVAVETSQRFTGAKPPVLLIVQDRSGSMNICFGTEAAGPGETCNDATQAERPYRSRMDISQTVMDDALASHENDAQYGLILYGIGGETGCGDASTLVSPSTTSSGAALIRQEYASNPAIDAPEGGTPTTKALMRALDTLVDASTGRLKAAYADRAAYVVLVTDGLMNCNDQHVMPCICSQETGCGGGVAFGQEGNLADPQLCLDRDDSVRMVQALASAGVKTFVIGLGETFQGQNLAVDVLNALATNGGRPRRDPASGQVLDPAFYSAGDRAALQSSINEILESITAPCEYELSGPVCEGRLIQVKLTIDGEPVATTCGAGENSWDFIAGDARRIRFAPALCSRMQSAGEVFVSIKGIESSCTGENGATGPACDLSAL